MKFVLVVIIHLINVSDPISHQVGTKIEGPFIFNSLKECRKHLTDNFDSLVSWGITLVPKYALVEDAGFFCLPEKELIPQFKLNI